MTCSRCFQEGHNCLNRLCPARVPGFVPSRPTAQLRPRTAPRVSGMRQTTLTIDPQRLFNFVRSFQEFAPEYHMLRSNISREVPYNAYALPLDRNENPYMNNGITEFFMTPQTHVLRIINLIGTDHVIALCVIRNLQIVILANVPYPVDEDVFIIIPQIPMLTINERPSFRLVSSYVKDWGITLDLSRQVSDTEIECVICAEEKLPSHFARTNCKHEYCVDCVKNDIRVNKDKTTKLSCPLCRTEISEVFVFDTDLHSELSEFILHV